MNRKGDGLSSPGASNMRDGGRPQGIAPTNEF